MGLIRLLLAIAVVIAHAGSLWGFTFVGGKVAVEAFFIISGFYMSLILNEKYKSSYELFITNRLLRLYPLYFVVLFLTLFVDFFTDKEIINLYHFSLLDVGSYSFLIATNICILFQDFILFLGLGKDGSLHFTNDFMASKPPLYLFLLIPQAWSISLELYFYFIAPFIVRRGAVIIASVLVASILLKLFLFGIGLDFDPWSYRFFPTELSFFLLGSVSYFIYKRIDFDKVNPSLVIFILLCIVTFITLYSKVYLPFKSYIFFALFALSVPFIFHLTKRIKVDTFIGDLSYPVYLTHLLMLKVVHGLGFKWHVGFWTIVFSIGLSIVLNELITKRVEKIRQKRVYKATL